MVHEIIMPALGMTQDTGVIVKWCKQAGDLIATSDIIAEVETDKTTMEIEAGYDGVVAFLKAEIGIPVPVGEMIALLATTHEEAVKFAQGPAPARASEADVAASCEVLASPRGAQSELPSPLRTPATGPALQTELQPARILASPKARRLARKRGINLQTLVAQGIRQPFHVSDLDAIPSTVIEPLAVIDELQMQVTTEIFDGFHARIITQTEARPTVGWFMAALVAGAFRKATGGDWQSKVGLHLKSFDVGGDDMVMQNPDLSGLRGIREMDPETPVELVLIDLSTSRLTEYRPGQRHAVPTLIMNRTPDRRFFKFALYYPVDHLSRVVAVQLLNNLVERVEDPFIQIL